MAIRNIVQEGDMTLRKKSFPVTAFNEDTWKLLDDMKETLERAEGVGLAAPQVGVLRRMFIVLYEDKYYEVINPVLSGLKGEVDDVEGCLSVRGKNGVVTRPKEMKVDFVDRFNKPKSLKLKGYITRIFCHEYDHLDGILYIDKAKYVEEK